MLEMSELVQTDQPQTKDLIYSTYQKFQTGQQCLQKSLGI